MCRHGAPGQQSAQLGGEPAREAEKEWPAGQEAQEGTGTWELGADWSASRAEHTATCDLGKDS